MTAVRRLQELEGRMRAVARAQAHPEVILRTPSELRQRRRQQRKAWLAGG